MIRIPELDGLAQARLPGEITLVAQTLADNPLAV
jgi:hypothetical protein